MDVLSKHRGGLNAIARALLDNEIIDGAEVARLVDEAHGSPVHDEGAKSVPHFHEAAISAPVGNGANGSGSGNGDGPHAEAEAGVAGGPVAVPHAAAGPPGRARRLAPPAVAPAGQPLGRRTGGTSGPLGTAHTRIEPNRAARRHEGGWWSNSSQTGWRRATWPPSALPA